MRRDPDNIPEMPAEEEGNDEFFVDSTQPPPEQRGAPNEDRLELESTTRKRQIEELDRSFPAEALERGKRYQQETTKALEDTPTDPQSSGLVEGSSLPMIADSTESRDPVLPTES